MKHRVQKNKNQKRGHLNKFGKDHPAHKEVIQRDKNNKRFIAVWETVTRASYENHVDMASISRCCHDKQQTAGGYTWEFKEIDSIRVNQINKHTKEIIKVWDSVAQATRELKLNNVRIRLVCNGRYRFEGGFIWEWVNG